LSTFAGSANGGKTFIPLEDITVNSSNYPLGVSTVSNSTGGDEKEILNDFQFWHLGRTL